MFAPNIENMKKMTVLALCSVLLLAGITGFLYVRQIIATGFAIDAPVSIVIDDRTGYDGVLSQIENKAHVESVANFEHVASFLKYPANVKSGRYVIEKGMTVLQVVRILKNGNQTPVKLTFNNVRTKEDLAGRIASQLMLDSGELMLALDNPGVCAGYGFSPETIGCMFIPNTYEFYWNISCANFLRRMDAEYKTFWNSSRQAKAEKTGLSPVEVSILASIVEEECFYADEYPVVAGLYINRLKSGQLLQADPTVKYALRDFGLKRILTRHISVDSPYNTYKYAGLPPGPIRIPSIKAIDAVLNHESHAYYYMCAKEDFSGRHNFARTHGEHQRNADKYHAALNSRKIYQ
jgi:UPF0755 protein